jgi:catechol-2,3-dioxygenase
MTDFAPLAHVALTVRELSVSVPWYQTLIGAEPVLDEDTDGGFRHVVFPIGGGMLLGLHQHTRPAPADAFTEYRIGLDHVGFGCATRADLQDWVGRLDAAGVPHGGIVDAGYGSGLSFRDPDGIALEFFAPPGDAAQ